MTTLGLFTNRATAKIAADVASGDSAITLVPGGGALFPGPAAGQYFRLVLQKGTGQQDQREYMICTGVAGDMLTVTRAQEGTPAANFTAGDEVSLVATAATLTGLVQRQGVTMQGALEVEADPTTPLGVATRQMVTAAAFPEAPADGKTYGRAMSAWLALGAAAGLAVPIPVTSGGTGAATAPAARVALGTNTTVFDDLAPATPAYGDRWIKPSNMTELVWAPNAGGGGAGIWINPADSASEAYPVAINKGGTGATTAAQARINLGLDAATGERMIPKDGTVALPGLAWLSEPGLGWYRKSAGVVGMAAGGFQTAEFSFTANVSQLRLFPETAGLSQFVLNNQPAGSANVNNLAITINADGSTQFANNAGGTATVKPMTWLGAASYNFDNALTATRVGIDPNIYLRQDTNAVYLAYAPNWFWAYDKATGTLTWNRSGAPSTGFQPNGDLYAGRNVYAGGPGYPALIGSTAGFPYIGFSSDSWRLQFVGSNGNLQYVNPSGTVLSQVDGGGSGFYAGSLGVNGVIKSGGSSGPSIWWDGGSTNFLRMQGGGNAATAWSLIWNTGTGALNWLGGSSQSLFSIDSAGNLNATGGLTLGGNLGAAYILSRGSVAFANDSTFWIGPGGEGKILNFAGSWYLGFNTSSGMLTWHSPSASAFWCDASGNFNVNTKGWQPGGGTWNNTSSDARTKDRVANYEPGLKEIISLRPVTYHYVEATGYDTEAEHVGLVAQECQGMPSLVRPAQAELAKLMDMPDLLTLDDGQLPYALINAIKTLNQRLTQLEMQ